MNRAHLNRLARTGLVTFGSIATLAAHAAGHDLEYVSEHLPEAAMNHRLASLPLWGPAPQTWSLTGQAGWSRATAGNLALSGPLAALGLQYRLSPRWTLTAFGFHDRLRFGGSSDNRPLEVRFARSVPLALPAEAEFSRLGGTARDTGAGLALGYEVEGGWFSDWRLTFGVVAQRMALSDYATRYRLLSGASAGATGLVDYSAGYTFAAGLFGLSRRFERGDWGVTPHALLSLPLVRRGVQGRITGDGFDISGDTGKVGQGKHYGDPALVFGLDLEYRPWRTSFDLGALVTQPVAEPAMHKGLDKSVLLSVSVRF